jgi:hypothetical protein
LSSFFSITSVNFTNTTTFLLSGIPQTYDILQIRIRSRRTVANFANLNLSLNNSGIGDHMRNYWLSTSGQTSVTNSTQTNANTFALASQAAGFGLDIFGRTIIEIPNYTTTSQNKTVMIQSGLVQNTSTGDNKVLLGIGLYTSSSAITSIMFSLGDSNNFSTDSRVDVYGIKGS